MRAILTLVAKDLRHHTIAVSGAAFILFMGWLASIAFALDHQDPSLLSAGVNAVYRFGGPYLATSVVRRWFIVEREDRSHELLLTLPMRDATRFWLRYAVALSLSVLGGEAALFATALLGFRQELAPAGWLLAIAVQIAAYLWAWTALSVLAAHLGRYRWPAWGIVFLAVASAGDYFGVEAFQVLGWQSVLAQPVVLTRTAFPWTGLAVTSAWASGATLAAFLLAISRQGYWVDRAWEPLTPQRRAVVAGLVAAVGLTGDLASVWHEDPPWVGVRAVSSKVRTAAPPGSLAAATAVQAAAILDAWGRDVPVLVVLRKETIEHDPPPAGRFVPVGVGDTERPRDALVRVLETALSAEEGPDWRRVGLAELHGARAVDPVARRRLAWAWQTSAADLHDWPALEARLGRPVAGAVAALALTLEGDPAFAAALQRELPRSAPPIQGSVRRSSAFGIGVVLDWTLDAAPADARLEWVALPPLRHLPADPPDFAPISLGTGSAPTRLDPTANIMARFVVSIPEDGDVTSGWTELPP